MLRVNNTSILNDLEMVIKRLFNLRDRLGSLGDDFGIHMDRPDYAHPVTGDIAGASGLSSLRTAITEVNVTLSQIDFEIERLWQARRELLGKIGTEPAWQEVSNPQLLQEIDRPANNPGQTRPLRQGDYRSHP